MEKELSTWVEADLVESTLEKMFPNQDLKDKYVLFIQSQLWFPHPFVDISGEIEFIFENRIETIKHKINTPYPNKNIKKMSAVNGRKVSNLGIPYIFDSFEDLKRLKNVFIHWEIDSLDEDENNVKQFLQVLYTVNFKNEQWSKIYNLYTKDSVVPTVNQYDELANYLDKFSDVAIIKNKGNKEIIATELKGDSLGQKTIALGEEEINIFIDANPELMGIGTNDTAVIYLYCKDIELSPAFKI